MLFHPEFQTEKEQRLIFEAPAAGAPAEGATSAPTPAVELTEKQKEIEERLKEIKEDPALAEKFKDFQVKQADKNAAELQERYNLAVTKAAQLQFNFDLSGSPESSLKAVNIAFAKTGVTFELGADGELAIVPKAPEGKEQPKEKGEKGRELTDAEKEFIKDAFPKNPKLAAVAERVMSQLKEDSPQFKIAEGLYNKFNALSPAEKRDVLNKPQARQKFFNALTPDEQQFMNQLSQDLTTTSKELSDDERQNIVDGAKKELQKFDVSKASEIDKNIMLARLQMRGIDTSAGEEILKDPKQMKAFEGSPMERGFHQIMGLIGYILLSIEKMKGSLKPKEKKTDAPTGDKDKKGPETSPTENELNKQVKEKGLLQVKFKKQTEIDQNNKILDGDPVAVAGSKEKRGLRGREVALKTQDAKLQAKSEQLNSQLKAIKKDTSPAEYASKEREISDNEAERKKITPELEEIQKQKTAAEARIAQLTTEVNSLVEIRKRTEALRQQVTDAKTEAEIALATPPIADRPEAKAILASLKEMVVILPPEADDRGTVEVISGSGKSVVDLALFNAGAEAVKKLGADSVAWNLEAGKTLKNPEAFVASLKQVMDKLKMKPEAKPAAAPTPAPATPPAAPTSSATPKP